MKELTRNELAICKRTAKSTKQLRDKKAKITNKIAELESELASIEESIEIFEAPIKHLTGGFTSEEVLNGTMDAINEQIEEMSKEAHRCKCCGKEISECTCEDNVTNEVENTQKNVNEAPVASNEIPFI